MPWELFAPYIVSQTLVGSCDDTLMCANKLMKKMYLTLGKAKIFTCTNKLFPPTHPEFSRNGTVSYNKVEVKINGFSTTITTSTMVAMIKHNLHQCIEEL